MVYSNALSEHREVLALFYILNSIVVSAAQRKEISKLTESVLIGTDFFLVDIKVKGSHTAVVDIFIDGTERGINMDECAEVSNELGFLIEAHEIFDGPYRLNVSSPGLDRPLTDPRQYTKNEGREVIIKFNDEEGLHAVQGILQGLEDEAVMVEAEEDGPRSIPLDEITETKVQPSFN